MSGTTRGKRSTSGLVVSTLPKGVVNEIEVELVRELAKPSFRNFCELFFPVPPFRGGYLIDCLAEHLQALHAGQIKRLAIACPIRHGKSTLCSILYPAWLWLHDPSLRILSASHTIGLAGDLCVESRRVIESILYQRCFGHIYQLQEDQDEKRHYQTDHGGQRKAFSVGTKTSGANADVILVDDLIDVKKSSEVECKNAVEYYNHVLARRLVHGTGKDRICVVGNRVNEIDLFAHLWETYGNSGSWTYLVLPAEARPSVTNSYFNGLGWKDTREEGAILYPERYTPEIIEDEKKALRHAYHTLYNQDPTPREGDLFKADWFRYYQDGGNVYELRHGESVQKFSKSRAFRVATLDTAVSTSSGADWTVCAVFDVVGDHLVLVDLLREKLDGNRIVPKLSAFVKLHNPQFLSVETEFIGRFVLDQLRQAGIPVKAFRARGHGDKETRAVSLEIRMEAGQVWFPKGKPWLADLEREILSFPHGAHDDQVDCLSQCCLVTDRYRGKVQPDKTPEEVQAERERVERERWFSGLDD